MDSILNFAQPSPDTVKQLTWFLQEDSVLNLRGFVFDEDQQREYDIYLEYEDRFSEKLLGFRGCLLNILQSTDAEELQQNLHQSLVPFLDLSIAHQEFFAFVGSDIFQRIQKGFSELSHVSTFFVLEHEQEESIYPRGFSKLWDGMVQLLKEMWERHLFYAGIAWRMQLPMGMDDFVLHQNEEQKTPENLIRYSVEVLKQQKDVLLGLLQAPKESLSSQDELGRRLVQSSLGFQTGILAILVVKQSQVPAPERRIFVELIKKTHEFSVAYKRYTELFWQTYFVRHFFRKMRTFQVVRNIYLDQGHHPIQILVDIEDTTPKEDLFQLYESEKQLLSHLEQPPIVKFYREPPMIPPAWKVI